MSTFAGNLKKEMVKRRLSLAALSRGTGIARSSLFSYLNGSEPQLGNLMILSKFLNLSIDELTHGFSASIDATDKTLQIKVEGMTYEITIRKSN
jgi:transcriptional regulator with XRE-family HTH domain